MYFRTLQIVLVVWYSANGTNSNVSFYFALETLTQRHEVGQIDSLEQNPSWDTNGQSSFPTLYGTQMLITVLSSKNPSLVPILSKIEASQRPFTLFNIHFNSIFPSTPRYSKVEQTLETINRGSWNYVRRTSISIFTENWRSILYKRTHFIRTNALFPTLQTSLFTFIYCRHNSVKLIVNIRSWDSVVGIETGDGLDDRGVGVRVPVGSRIFFSSRRPDRLWGPPSLLSNEYREFFPQG
jgi:hypothetical protein